MRTKIVAEISANHLGRIARALALVEAAARAGAWGVKFQTYTPEQMADPGTIVQAGPWAGRNLLELYRAAYTPRDWHQPLFERARQLGLVPFSSVFHQDDVDFLETIGCQLYKIASFEITDLELIRHAADTYKPLVISTGMATKREIEQAAWAAAESPHLTLLKCTSAYPARACDANLRTMDHLTRIVGCSAMGLSDHTIGIGVAVAAVALGAGMIEKHLTLARADGGLDAAFSMEPDEFAQMVIECGRAEEAVGEVTFGAAITEASSQALRRTPGAKRGSPD